MPPVKLHAPTEQARHLFDRYEHNGLRARGAPSPSAYRPSNPQLASKRSTLAFSLMVLISASVNLLGLLA